MSEAEGKADEGKGKSMAEQLAEGSHPKVGPGAKDGDVDTNVDPIAAMFALEGDDADEDVGDEDEADNSDDGAGDADDDSDEGDDSGDDDTGNREKNQKSPKESSFKTKEAAEKAHKHAEKKLQETLNERDNLKRDVSNLSERLEKLESGDKKAKAEDERAKILERTAEQMAELEYPADPTDKKAVHSYNKQVATIMAEQADDLAKLNRPEPASNNSTLTSKQREAREYVESKFKEKGLDKYLQEFYKIVPASGAKTVDEAINWGVDHFRAVEGEMKKAYDDKFADKMGDETSTPGGSRGRGKQNRAEGKKDYQPMSMADQINQMKKHQMGIK